MPSITRIVLSNFKRLDGLELKLSSDLNILLGDNEAGKSSVLLAIDLVLSASQSKADGLGVESLLPVHAVKSFMAGKRAFGDLPKLLAEVYLTNSGNPDYSGNNNSQRIECDGLKMECEVPDDVSKQVVELLEDPEAPFPYEYYATSFWTFAGQAYSGYKKHHVRHLVLDSSRIDSEHAAREYTRSLYTMNTEPRERYKLESDYRRNKEDFQTKRLGDLNAKISGDAQVVSRLQFAAGETRGERSRRPRDSEPRGPPRRPSPRHEDHARPGAVGGRGLPIRRTGCGSWRASRRSPRMWRPPRR